MTNGDAIRAMNDEYLAEWLTGIFEEAYAQLVKNDMIKDFGIDPYEILEPSEKIAGQWLKWLKEEASE